MSLVTKPGTGALLAAGCGTAIASVCAVGLFVRKSRNCISAGAVNRIRTAGAMQNMMGKISRTGVLLASFSAACRARSRSSS